MMLVELPAPPPELIPEVEDIESLLKSARRLSAAVDRYDRNLAGKPVSYSLSRDERLLTQELLAEVWRDDQALTKALMPAPVSECPEPPGAPRPPFCRDLSSAGIVSPSDQYPQEDSNL